MGHTDSSIRTRITEGRILVALSHLAAPMLISAVLQNAQSLIDLFWVGRLGHEAVAAVAMSGTILMLLFPMVMGISTGTVALVSRAIGARRAEEASGAAAQSLMLAIGLGTATALAGWLAATPLLHLLGAEEEVVGSGSAYLKIFLAGSFTVYILFIGNAALQGAGDTRTPMFIMAVANILNIVLDPLFIFGVGPLPRLGVAGAALATVISQACAATLSVWILVGGRAHLHLHRAHWKFDAPLASRILRIGIPGSGQMLSRSLMSLVLMRIVAGFGTAAVAAYGTGLRFHMILLMPAFALGASAATMMGQNLGAGNPNRARRAVWLAAGIDAVFMIVAAALMMTFAPSLIGVFNAHPEVVTIGSRYFRVVSPFYVFAPIGIVLSRGLQGAGDTVAPMVITILSLWGLQVPLAAVLSRVLQPGTDGIWWAIAAAFVAQALLMTAWFETGRWRTRRV